MLAVHVGRFDEAAQALTKAVNTEKTSPTGNQVEAALEAMAEGASKQSRFGASAHLYDLIDKTWSAKMSDGGKSIKEKRHVGALPQHVPALTIHMSADFTLMRDGLEYPVSVGGNGSSAQLDTGAEISVLSATTAKKWNVTMLEGTATLHGYGGRAFAAQPGFIPVVTIGQAELHNVAV